ncbi:hypothetical protein ABEZ49_28705 [Bacillus mycoides]
MADCVRFILEKRKCNWSSRIYFSWSRFLYVYSPLLP